MNDEFSPVHTQTLPNLVTTAATIFDAMAHQSPMISIPRKTTEDVDWTSPIRTSIAQSYGENPDNYASECALLQRCRQDAVKGAGSDMTGTFSLRHLYCLPIHFAL